MIKDFNIGEKISGICLCLKSLTQRNDGNYFAVFSDKSGEICGSIRNELITDDIKSLVKGVVCISAVVKPGNERIPTLNIKEILRADKDKYKTSEIFDGLSEEKIAEYKKIIEVAKLNVKHEGYRKLLDVALDEASLKKLSEMPATLSYYGTYKGGALAGATLITLMCKDSGVEYVTHFNGLHQGTLNWSLLLTASLLCTYGVLNYITPIEPFQKTPIGVDRGYCSILQSMLERLCILHEIPLTDEELSRLLNVLSCAVSKRTSVKATTKEGILLRHCLALYAELDMLDYGVSEHEKEDSEESYFYAKNLNRYISA